VCTRAVSPEEAVCAHCGVLVHKPAHDRWPAAVKWFALWEYARSTRWHSWVSEQELWTFLVCQIVNGSRSGFARPNPFGLTTSAPIERCLPLVAPIATAWRAAGAPFTQQQFVPPSDPPSAA
jgi:hypothetical protein